MDYSIGEFATLMQVTVKTLHHYDKIGLLPPDSIDAQSGYRRYSVNQLHTMKQIYDYRELGFSLSQIRTLLDPETADSQYFQIFRARRAELATQIHRDKEILARICETLGKGNDSDQPPFWLPAPEISEISSCAIFEPAVYRFSDSSLLPERLAVWSQPTRSLGKRALKAALSDLRSMAEHLNPWLKDVDTYWFWGEVADDPHDAPFVLHFAVSWEAQQPPIDAQVLSRPTGEAEFHFISTDSTTWRESLAFTHSQIFEQGFIPRGPLFFHAKSGSPELITHGVQIAVGFKQAGADFAGLNSGTGHFAQQPVTGEEDDEVTEPQDLNPFSHLQRSSQPYGEYLY